MKKVSLASLILASGLVVAGCGQEKEAEKDEATNNKPESEEVVEQEEQKETEQEESEQAEQEDSTVEASEKEEEKKVESDKVAQNTEPSKESSKEPTKPVEKPVTTKPSVQAPTTTKPVEKPATNQTAGSQTNTNTNTNTGTSTNTGGQTNTGSTKPNVEQDKKPAYTYTAQSILNKVKAVYGSSYLPNMPLDATMVSETFNVDLSLVEDFVSEMPMIGFHPDKVLIVKAKEGKIKEVVAQLEAARKDMIANTINYPANAEKIKSIKVVSKDNYAAFFLLGSAENNSEDPEERLKFAETEVQKAVAAFNGMF